MVCVGTVIDAVVPSDSHSTAISTLTWRSPASIIPSTPSIRSMVMVSAPDPVGKVDRPKCSSGLLKSPP